MSDSVQLFCLEDILEKIDLGNLKQHEISSQEKILSYIELEKRRQEIGEKGEQFVYEQEVSRLKKVGSEYVNKVSRNPSKDPKNGYDIDSFTETGQKIYIEVKSTMGSVEEPFYMTANEREKARQIKENGGIYQIHRVYNIGQSKKTQVVIYDDLELLRFEEILYRVEVK